MYLVVVMVTISHVVQDILNKHVFFQEALNQGIISYNKLADNIKPEIEDILGREIKFNAIVMALRRYSEKLGKNQHKFSLNYFHETLLKTDVCYILIEESPTALNNIQSIYDKMVIKQGKIFNIVHGNYEIGIITNELNKNKILNELAQENILRIVENLVVISLKYSKDYLFTPGIIYNVLRFFAWENINVISMTVTPQELNFVVGRKDAMKTYDTLEKLVNTSKDNGSQ